MRSLDSPPVEVAIDSPERRDYVSSSSSSNNGSSLHSSLGDVSRRKFCLSIALYSTWALLFNIRLVMIVVDIG